MAMPNINELLVETQNRAQYRVVRYLQNRYLRVSGIDNEYSSALQLIHDRQDAERAEAEATNGH